MTNQKKDQIKLSYESDGKMGQNLKETKKKPPVKEFFNTTPGSE